MVDKKFVDSVKKATVPRYFKSYTDASMHGWRKGNIVKECQQEDHGLI